MFALKKKVLLGFALIAVTVVSVIAAFGLIQRVSVVHAATVKSTEKTLGDCSDSFKEQDGVNLGQYTYTNELSLGKTLDETGNCHLSFELQFSSVRDYAKTICVSYTSGYYVGIGISAANKLSLKDVKYEITDGVIAETPKKITLGTDIQNCLSELVAGDCARFEFFFSKSDFSISVYYKGIETSYSGKQQKSVGVNSKLALWSSGVSDNDIALYNSFYSVTAKDKDGQTVVQKVYRGEKIDKTQLPDCSDYEVDGEKFKFKGWYCNGEEFDFETPVTKELELTATYDKEAEEPALTVVSIVDENGKEIATVSDGDISLDDIKSKVEDEQNKFIGFRYEENLYAKFSDMTIDVENAVVVAETRKVYMKSGAAVRTVAPYGIRFTAYADADMGDYGIVLTAHEFISDNNCDFTIEALKSRNIHYETIGKSSDMKERITDNLSEFSLALVNIKEENFAVDFAARAFVEVKYADGAKSYVYSDFTVENNCRSVYEVARKGLNNSADEQFKSVYKIYVDGVVELATVDGEITVKSNPENYEIKIEILDGTVTLTLVSAIADYDVSKVKSVIFDGKRIKGVENNGGVIKLQI